MRERNIFQILKDIFSRPVVDMWEYGICNGLPARRHKVKKNVQMKLWTAGEQGHKEDYWHDFDKSWWNTFLKQPQHGK